LSLEGWSLFEGSLAGWASSPLSASLRSLSLMRCDLVGDCSAYVLRALQGIEYLELSWCRLGGPRALEQLLAPLQDAHGTRGHPLQELILHQCITEQGGDVLLQTPFWGAADAPIPSPLRHLQHCPALRVLILQHSDMPASLPESDRIRAAMQQLMVEHIKALAALLCSSTCQLQSITWARAAFSSEASWCALEVPSSCRSVTALDLSLGVDLSDASLERLSSSFPSLVRLDISFARRPHGEQAAAEEEGDRDEVPAAAAVGQGRTEATPAQEHTLNYPLATESAATAAVDAPIVSYSPAGVLRAVANLPRLRLLRALCYSAADAGELMQPALLQQYKAANAQCRVVASRWQ